MPFRFLHAADLHLDTPFSSLAGVPEPVAHELREASLRAFANLVDTALAEHVDFVVLAGDIYDGAERGVRAQLAFARGLERLADAGIATFIAYGNHDPLHEGWSAIEQFPELVTVFPADDVASFPITVGEKKVGTISGISYATAETTENLAARFPKPKGRGFHLAVLHANVGAQSGHQPYSPCSLDDLRGSGHHYWALGHIHRRQSFGDDVPRVEYPGNLQGRSAKPSEQGAKGAVIVEVDGVHVAEPRFVALDRVRFETVEVSIEDRTLDGLERALVEAARGRLAESDGRSLVVRGRIVGRGALHTDLASPGRRADLLLQLRDVVGIATPFIWWDRLDWETAPEVDLAERHRGDDFVADLLRVTAAVGGGADSDAPDPRLAWVPEVGTEYRGWLGDDLPRPDDPGIWDDAVVAALDLLLADDN